MDDHESRLKRIVMRSWRRGTREMDLILGPFAEAELAAMDADSLDAYERLLEENDQDLYLWVSGALPCPEVYAELLATIAHFARSRHLNVRA